MSGVDQRIRDCVQVLWLSLPAGHRTYDELAEHFRRLTDRALKDFSEDMALFGDEVESDK